MSSLATSELTQVIELWTERTEKLISRPDIDYVLIFENRGREAGATLEHPHGQIYAYEMVPPAAMSELDSDRCALCSTVAESHVVEELDGWTAVTPTVARWPYELLIAPSAHVPGLPDLDDGDRGAMADLLGRSLRRIDAVLGKDCPLLLWVHQLPGRSDLSALAHLHVHVAPLFRAPGVPRLIAAGEHGSGIVFNTVGAREAAEALRHAVDTCP